MTTALLALVFLGLAVGLLSAADSPGAEISNGHIRVKMHLPDPKTGYYRGTRFDWSGVIYSLQYKGHEFYGQWFHKADPKVHDFVFEGPDIVTGSCSAVTGPVDEFHEVGWHEAKAGGTFVKIGIGALRKPDNGKYDKYTQYEVVNPGKWTVERSRDSVSFIQELVDPSSGYGYIYRKTVRLAKDTAEMVLEHSLKNTGTRTIDTSVYNHNFLALDKQPSGPGFVTTLPFRIETPEPPNKSLAVVRGNQLVYLKTLKDRDVVAFPVHGFGDGSEDNAIRIENAEAGAGFTARGDRPLSEVYLWSIRTVISVEPFISVKIEPGSEFTWKITYNYYTLPAGAK